MVMILKYNGLIILLIESVLTIFFLNWFSADIDNENLKFLSKLWIKIEFVSLKQSKSRPGDTHLHASY